MPGSFCPIPTASSKRSCPLSTASRTAKAAARLKTLCSGNRRFPLIETPLRLSETQIPIRPLKFLTRMPSFVSKQTVFNERAEASPDVRFRRTKSKAEDKRIDRMRLVPLCLVVEREMANRRVGEWACRRMKARDRWGEKLGAPRMWLTAKTVPRRF
jgi:hypothetical protein